MAGTLVSGKHVSSRFCESYGLTLQDEPFFWQADTAWEIFHRLDCNEVKKYLNHRATQGFNVIFGVLL